LLQTAAKRESRGEIEMTTDMQEQALSAKKLHTRLWHPFADMGVVDGHELVIDRGEDVWVYDQDGRRYLDATASLWYSNVGHGRSEIADAVREQMSRLEAYSAFGDFSNEPARALASRLSELAPIPNARVFLTTGGGESIDTAAKLARQYWAAQGTPERVHLISRVAGYHGTNGFGTSLGGIEANRVGFGPLVAETSIIEHDSLPALERAIDQLGPERVAAFFVEPVIGAGGVYPPPDGYIEGVAAICADAGVLLIVDSVICGFGRLGSWFGVERWSIEPDMIVFAKGVTSGYLPLGGVIISEKIAEPFWKEPGRFFRHGATYSGHASCCAAALANIEILERENLIGRGAELEQTLFDALSPLVDHPLVGEVRGGTGLMAAVELDAAALASGVQVAHVSTALRERGVLARPLGRAVAVSPPLTVQGEHIGLIAEAMQEALDAVLPAQAATTAL
jgi:adenosylmethionine-8-amino-7-oxononanoate aminotransferase